MIIEKKYFFCSAFIFLKTLFLYGQLPNLDLPESHPLRKIKYLQENKTTKEESAGYLVGTVNYGGLPIGNASGTLTIGFKDPSGNPVNFSKELSEQKKLRIGEFGFSYGKFGSFPIHLEGFLGYGKTNDFSRLYGQVGFGTMISPFERNRTFIRPVLAVNYGNVRYNMVDPTEYGSGPIRLGNSSLDTKDLEISILQNPILIVPRVDVVVRLSPWIYFTVASGYQYALNPRNKLVVSGTEFSGNTKKVKKIEIPDEKNTLFVGNNLIQNGFFRMKGLFFSVGLSIGKIKE